MNTTILKFDELSNELKDRVISNYLENEFLVPDNWWEDIYVQIQEKAENEYAVDIDLESIEFDLYRNELNYSGTVDFDNKINIELMSDSLLSYIEKEWIYNILESFESIELDGEYYTDSDLIHQSIETFIFGDNEFNIDNGVVIIPIEDMEDIKKITNSNLYMFLNHNLIDNIQSKIEIAELFFQDYIEIDESDYDDLLNEAVIEIENNIDSEFSSFKENINSNLEDIYNDFFKSLSETYEWYQSEEHAKEQFTDKVFVVEIDDNGNQLDIEDLYGDFE